MTTTYPRGVEARLAWMRDHEPGEAGLCANWTWKSMGGDHGNPAAWGCADANEVVDKVRAAGGLFTSRDAPRGAFVLYTSSTHGHMCLSKGYQYDFDIMTTDPNGDWGATGTWTQQGPIDEWGQKWAGWGIRYNGVLLPMSEPGAVYVSSLKRGSGSDESSDSVIRLQDVLNHTSIPAPGNVDLPPTGYYGDQTATVVGAWQKAHGYADTGELTNDQADALFSSWDGYDVVHEDVEVPPVDPPDGGGGEPEPPSEITLDTSWSKYSGKPGGTLTITDDAGYVKVDASVAAAPLSGLEFHMLYANLDLSWDSGSQDGWIRVKYVRDGGDATAYQDYSVVRGMGDFLITAQHWEAGEAGVGGRWYVNVGGGIAKATVGTRYVKAGGVPDSISAELEAVGSAVSLSRDGAIVLALVAFLVLAGMTALGMT